MQIIDVFKAIESDLHKISKKSGSVKNFTKFCKVKLKLTTVLPLSGYCIKSNK